MRSHTIIARPTVCVAPCGVVYARVRVARVAGAPISWLPQHGWLPQRSLRSTNRKMDRALVFSLLGLPPGVKTVACTLYTRHAFVYGVPLVDRVTRRAVESATTDFKRVSKAVCASTGAAITPRFNVGCLCVVLCVTGEHGAISS